MALVRNRTSSVLREFRKSLLASFESVFLSVVDADLSADSDAGYTFTPQTWAVEVTGHRLAFTSTPCLRLTPLSEYESPEALNSESHVELVVDVTVLLGEGDVVLKDPQPTPESVEAVLVQAAFDAAHAALACLTNNTQGVVGKSGVEGVFTARPTHVVHDTDSTDSATVVRVTTAVGVRQTRDGFF